MFTKVHSYSSRLLVWEIIMISWTFQNTKVIVVEQEKKNKGEKKHYGEVEFSAQGCDKHLVTFWQDAAEEFIFYLRMHHRLR